MLSPKELDKRFRRVIGARVFTFRTMNGMSRREVADYIGCSYRAYYRKERGESPFTAYELHMIARMYDIDWRAFDPYHLMELPGLESIELIAQDRGWK